MFTSITGKTAKSNDRTSNATRNSGLSKILPTTDQLIEILKDTFNFPINDDGLLEVNIKTVLEENFDLTAAPFVQTFETFNVYDLVDRLCTGPLCDYLPTVLQLLNYNTK